MTTVDLTDLPGPFAASLLRAALIAASCSALEDGSACRTCAERALQSMGYGDGCTCTDDDDCDDCVRLNALRDLGLTILNAQNCEAPASELQRLDTLLRNAAASGDTAGLDEFWRSLTVALDALHRVRTLHRLVTVRTCSTATPSARRSALRRSLTRRGTRSLHPGGPPPTTSLVLAARAPGARLSA